MALLLKEIMSEKSVSSAWLAKQTGLSKVSISNILTGKASPSIDNLMKIAEALQVTVNDLVYQKDWENHIICPHCGGKIKIEKGE